MINQIKIFSLLSVFAVWLLASCSVDKFGQGAREDASGTPQLDESVVSGELLVCFRPYVTEILENAGLTKSGIDAPATRSGILSVDRVLELVEGYQIERVFPFDKRSEEDTRQAGLHLWYVVRFPDTYSVEKVAADLSRLGEVSRVEYNRTLKRASQDKVIPLTADLLDEVSAETDPLYGLQWYLKNDGSLQNMLKDATVDKFVSGADISAEGAWEKCTGNPSIIVAVLDEGVDVTHPDLAKSMWINEGEVYGSTEDADKNGYAGDLHGYNFVKKTGNITVNSRYDTGHGTHVAGTIAARNNNGKGIRSIAGGDGTPDSGVRIMSCQIFAGEYAGTLLDEVRAIKYAADNGAVVLQCSWGYISGAANPYDWAPQFSDDEQWETYNPLEKQALMYFVNTAGSPDGVIDGGVVVYAGGNEAAAAAAYPGAYKDFISVAAVAADYTPAAYSNYGMGITISAPGGDQDYYYEFCPTDASGYPIKEYMGSVGCILSTIPQWHTESELPGVDGDFYGYGYMEGTSMACPQVSGVVALGLSYALEKRKHFKVQEFIDLLHSTATNFDERLVGEKLWYKYVIDLEKNHPSLIDLASYRKKMGTGLVNAEALLNAIDGEDVGKPMTFPNVLISAGSSRIIDPAIYFENGKSLEYTASSSNAEVAEVKVADGKVHICAKAKGQTAAVVKGGDKEQHFVITVKSAGSADNSWL